MKRYPIASLLRAPTLRAPALRLPLALILVVGVLFAAASPARGQDDDRTLRERMVAEQIVERNITDRQVLEALREVPRHRFVPEAVRGQAYEDHPLAIGYGQTISQPFIVALMTHLLELDGDERVLEIGTGSGYHSAVLSRIAREVYTIEIVEPLGRQAQSTLASLGYDNVQVRLGDGYGGWPEKQPFDAIILTAAPPHIPQPLIDQLKVGGKMVVPVGDFLQDLLVITKTPDGQERRKVAPVRFVPMTGEVQERGGSGRRP